MKFKTLDAHEKDCKRIQKSLLQSNSTIALAKKSTSNTHLTRNKDYKKKLNLIDTSSLNAIIEIDENKKIALVEPGVTMESLVKACLKKGLIPLVTPEFKNITVGGAIMGAALESSSYKYGQFNNICNKCRVLIGSGEILEVSKDSHSDLFWAMSGSYGTLCLLLQVEVQLEKSQEFVEMTFSRFNDHNSLIEQLKKVLKQDSAPSFIEAIVFSKQEGVLITADKKSKKNLSVQSKILSLNSFGQLFYNIIKKNKQLKPIALNTLDYLFRFDRGAFWMAHYLSSPLWFLKYLFKRKEFETHKIPFKSSLVFERLICFFLGPFLSSSLLYKKLHSIDEDWFKKTFVVQDFYIPINSLHAFLSDVDHKTGIYPLWLCPVKTTKKPEIFAPHYNKKTDFVIDVGIYGIPQKRLCSIKLTKDLENCLSNVEGKKMFYAHSYYSRENLNEMYEMKSYDELRRKYSCEGVFLPFEEKVL
jgi:delta24-sterol reductase